VLQALCVAHVFTIGLTVCSSLAKDESIDDLVYFQVVHGSPTRTTKRMRLRAEGQVNEVTQWSIMSITSEYCEYKDWISIRSSQTHLHPISLLYHRTTFAEDSPINRLSSPSDSTVQFPSNPRHVHQSRNRLCARWQRPFRTHKSSSERP
jgi:hypothetical protein